MSSTEVVPLALRPAAPADSELVFRLNNEPTARAQSIRTAPIPRAGHEAWYRARLCDPAALTWVVEAAGRGVAVVRADVSAGEATISIAVDPDWRGRGVGTWAIRGATEAIRRERAVAVVALIRPQNAASLRAFAAAGYAGEVEVEVEGVQLVRLVHPAAPAAAVLCRCDGGGTVGWGHAIRCAALAAALQEQGAGAALLMHAPDPGLVRQIEGSGVRVQRLDGDPAGVDATAAAVRAAGARLLVVDSYVLGRAFLDGVRDATGVPRVVVDDLADRDLPCEAVVNGNPWARELDLGRFGAALRLCGGDHALLRTDFAPGRRPARRPDSDCPQVLVTLGGGRLGGLAVEHARALDRLDRPLRIALLVGSDPEAAAAARAFAATARHPAEVHAGTAAVADLFARTTIALSAAGTTCFELAAMGVPALLLVAADNQAPGGKRWHATGAFALLGALGEVPPAHAAACVAALLDDPAAQAAMSERARTLVPGDGAARTAAALIAAFTLRGAR